MCNVKIRKLAKKKRFRLLCGPVGIRSLVSLGKNRAIGLLDFIPQPWTKSKKGLEKEEWDSVGLCRLKNNYRQILDSVQECVNSK